MTKIFALGALGAGVAYAAVRARRRAALQKQQTGAFDYGDLDEPVVVTEEVVIITEAVPLESDAAQQQQQQGEQTFEPGRGAGPR